MPTVTRKAVNQMIASILKNGLDGEGIRVLLPHEPPPEHDEDKAGDSAVDRWCKMHRAEIRSNSKQGSTADERLVSMTLSIGVSGEELDIRPHRLDDDTQLVLDVLEDAYFDHSDTKHSINIFRGDSDIETAGEHDSDAIGIVTITASARRKN